MYKTYHFVCFFNLLANVQILPRHFLPVFVMEWCLRSADALGPCNWTVFFCGNENLVNLGTLKKKSTKSDHVYYTLKIFENFMFLEDENVPLVLGGLIVRSCFLVLSSDFCIGRLCRFVLSSDSLIVRSCFLVLSSDSPYHWFAIDLQ